jgi:hypothetical protein
MRTIEIHQPLEPRWSRGARAAAEAANRPTRLGNKLTKSRPESGGASKRR